MKTNKNHLVELSLLGTIHAPTLLAPYVITHDGIPKVMPSLGGIVYNFAIGDNCMDLAGDHIEPGVSLFADNTRESQALNTLSCVGNPARVVSGDAKDAVGFVTGKHGGIEHVLCYFPKEDLEKMIPGDKILIKSKGQGLALTDRPDIHVQNLDPELLEKMNIKEEGGKLKVGVKAFIPAHLMGAGQGSSSGYSGDYDIMTGDAQALSEHGLHELCFGDLVLLQDCDNTFGRQYLKGAATIGIIIHSNCVLSGHGPGVTTLLTSKKGLLEGFFDENANLKGLMGVE